MPTGVLHWYEPATGEARVVRQGKEFPVPPGELDRSARAVGARVHFDIHREQGVDYAIAVEARSGARASRRRRANDRPGARYDKGVAHAPFAAPHPEFGLDLDTQPMRVARHWAQALASGDLSELLGLFAPDASLHHSEGTVRGQRRLQAFLETLDLLGAGASPSGWRSDDRLVHLTWDGTGVTATLRVRHGEVDEAWWNVERAAPEPQPPTPKVDLAVHGSVPESAVDYARHRIATLLDKIDEPVLHARIKLGQLGDPAVERRWTAEAALDLDGSMLRANVAGHAPNEAVDLLISRIADRLEHRRDRENRRATALEPEPGQWRHGNLPTHRPPFLERPRDECELVRHKTVADEPVTVEEAAWDMAQLDYDIYLFRELGTDADCALRTEADGLHLDVLGADAAPATGTVVAQVSSAVPRLGVREAIDWLDGSGSRFVFFENARTGRGNVLYRRYDGNFGVITPSTESREDRNGAENRGDQTKSLDADHEDLTLAAEL